MIASLQGQRKQVEGQRKEQVEINLRVNDGVPKVERKNIPAELKVVEKKQMVPEKVWGRRNRSEMRIVKGTVRISMGIVEHERDHFFRVMWAEGCVDWFPSGNEMLARLLL